MQAVPKVLHFKEIPPEALLEVSSWERLLRRFQDRVWLRETSSWKLDEHDGEHESRCDWLGQLATAAVAEWRDVWSFQNGVVWQNARQFETD